MTIPKPPETWAEKKARLVKRGRRTRTVTLLDHESGDAVAAAKAVVGEVELQVRSGAQRKHRDLAPAEREKAIRADVAKSRKVATARKALAAAEQNHADLNIDIELCALGSHEYEELVAAHPPRDQDEKKGRDYNLDTFAPALVAACSTDDMDIEDAADMLRDLSQGEAGLLFTQAVEINQTGHVALGKG